MKATVLHELGIPCDMSLDSAFSAQIDEAIAEVKRYAQFRYRYAHYNQLLPFLSSSPAYLNYLFPHEHSEAAAVEYLLCAATLGIQIDRQLQKHQIGNLAYATILNAAANAYLEYCADTYEHSLPFPSRDYRFCPGYQATPLSDNRLIADHVQAAQIGITFSDSGLMVPLKSMMGIIRIGDEQAKRCDDCAVFSHCSFRMRGTRCYG